MSQNECFIACIPKLHTSDLVWCERNKKELGTHEFFPQIITKRVHLRIFLTGLYFEDYESNHRRLDSC